eukprot:120994_1
MQLTMRPSVSTCVFGGLIVALFFIVNYRDTSINDIFCSECQRFKRELLEMQTIGIDPKTQEPLSKKGAIEFAFWKEPGCTTEKLAKLDDPQTIAVLTSIDITKDEFIQQKNCQLNEQDYSALQKKIQDPLDAGQGIANKIQQKVKSTSAAWKLNTVFTSFKYFTVFSFLIVSSSFILMI